MQSTIAKIVLVGDGGVGKTTLRNKYMGLGFESQYYTTIGADFALKSVHIENNNRKYDFKFQCWDLAGQTKFHEVRSVYYSGAVGAVVIYDVTRPDTYEHTILWLMEIRKNSGIGPIPVILLGNKTDLRDYVENAVTKGQGIALADEIPKHYFKNQNLEIEVPYLETSAKTGKNVNTTFNKLAKMILDWNALEEKNKN